MELNLNLPSAFSVHDENEFYAFQHLMARLHPQLRVTQMITGKHINGGCTVFWGLVHFGNDDVPEDDVHTALKEAGFDFEFNRPVGALKVPEVEHATAYDEPVVAGFARRGDHPDQACFADG
jgi:hypothetical protein